MIDFIIEENGETRRVEVRTVPVHIGRAEEAEVPIVNDRASRHHARLEVVGDEFVLIDLDSSNGTFLKGERIKRVRLTRGDKIEIGSATLTFAGGKPPPPAPEKVKSLVDLPGFTMLDDLGIGVLSRVYMARQDALSRKVAVKVLRDRWVGNVAVVDRFRTLARRQARLHHPSLASGIDVGEESGVPYFVVEYLEGDTVGARVRTRMAFETTEAMRILGEVLEVMGWVHEQDRTLSNLHPESVVLGDGGEVWVASIGFPLPSARTLPDEHAGELAFVAPEALPEPEAAGPRGDVFQAGALAWFMVTGRPPRVVGATDDAFEKVSEIPDISELESRSSLPSSVRGFIMRLLAADPAQRPENGTAALRELEALKDDVVAARSRMASSAKVVEERSADGPKSFRRSKKFIMVNRVITVTIAVVLNLAFFLWYTGREKNDNEPERDDVAEVPAPSIDNGNGSGDGEGNGVHTKTPTLQETERLAAAAWESTEESVKALTEAENYAEAAQVAATFSTRWAGTTWAQNAVDLLQAVQRRREEACTEALDELEAKIESSKLSQARGLLSRARALASGVKDKRLRDLEEKLRDAEIAHRKAEAARNRRPGPERGPKPRTGPERGTPTRPKGIPRSQWPKLVKRALASPGSADLRTKLLKSAADNGGAGKLATQFRWLAALDCGMKDLAAAWTALAGKEVKIPLRDGKEQVGTLKELQAGSLVVAHEGADVEVPISRVAPAEMARMLSGLPPTLDRYLARALLDLLAREPEDAWFDLQGARIICGDDADARKLVEAQLAELRKTGGRR